MGKRIWAFAARNGAGKETAAQKIALMLGGAETHTYSDILFETFEIWSFAKEQIARTDLQALSTFMRQLKGEDAMAKVMVKKCREARTDWVVIDGVRRLSDLDLLITEFGAERVRLDWIEASADVRYERLKARKQKAGEAFKTRAQFDAEEQAESERQLDDVRRACAHAIDNNGTLAELENQLAALYHDVAIGPVAYG